jgi:prepilin-type processing-associated H-X9-DG protein
LDKDKNLLYEIPLAPSPYWSWFQSWTLPDGRTHIGANLDNYFPKDSLGRYTDEDFYFTVEFRGSSPIKVQIGPCDGSANTGYGKWSDFRLNHKAIWDGQVFGNLFAAGHVGEVIDVQKELSKDTSRNLKNRRRASYATWTVMSTSKAILGATSYGLNRGSYQALDDTDPRGYRDVPRMDPKLIFILDYPKAIADMTDIGDTLGEKDYFDYIFIKSELPDFEMPPKNWSPPPGLEGRTWPEVQALRHAERANVLFCDGHIEAMEKNELNLSTTGDVRLGPMLWNYQGK